MKAFSGLCFGALHGFLWNPELNLSVIAMCFVTAFTGSLMGRLHGKVLQAIKSQSYGFVLG